ncbi:protein spinster isoform X4 [Anopheles stephensi]|uniref:protein spinster isoform X4 n=1 Tax=Anopheles stephensi TaxID=30069 RepID=UPI001658B6EF|nr:protein spinster isoform X4 [Anopheles stephensi]
MPSSQGYSKVASEPPIDPVDGTVSMPAGGGNPGSGSSTAMTPATGGIQSNPAGKIPATNSQQRLMPTDSDSVTSSMDEGYGGTDTRNSQDEDAATTAIGSNAWFTVIVLCFVNLINYMDRFTIAGVLTEIQDTFQIGDDEGGLLQTAFVLSYMLFAPLFGYLGDRYSRKWIMVLGVTLWSTTTLAGSYMKTFGWFITFRALVGVGEASYSTIAPTIISDLFVGEMRSKMLALFYFAIPVGSGCGYIVGAKMASIMESWQWSLRVTPVLGAIAVALIIMLRDPERGQSEGTNHIQATSYKTDVAAIVRNPSFMLSTLGFTCVAFVTGALAWWGPKFIHLGLISQPGNEHITLNDVSSRFGVVAMLAGLIGVPLGTVLSNRLRPLYPNADPLICASGLITSSPFIYIALVVVKYSSAWCFTLVFIAEVALNMSWPIVADMLLYVVVPTRRSTAEAFQILISHAFGDAGSPYFVGVISEAIKRAIRASADALSSKTFLTIATTQSIAVLSQLAENSTVAAVDDSPLAAAVTEDDPPLVKFRALQYALFSTCFVEVLGGVFFLLTSIFIDRDRARVQAAILGDESNNASAQQLGGSVSDMESLQPRTRQ